MLYIRKPITVYAHQWFPGRVIDGVRYEEHCEYDGPNDHLICSDVIVRDNPHIVTIDGVKVYVEPGDWVVDSEGEITAVKPDRFIKEYSVSKGA